MDNNMIYISRLDIFREKIFEKDPVYGTEKSIIIEKDNIRNIYDFYTDIVIKNNKRNTVYFFS